MRGMGLSSPQRAREPWSRGVLRYVGGSNRPPPDTLPVIDAHGSGTRRGPLAGLASCFQSDLEKDRTLTGVAPPERRALASAVAPHRATLEARSRQLGTPE